MIQLVHTHTRVHIQARRPPPHCIAPECLHKEDSEICWHNYHQHHHLNHQHILFSIMCGIYHNPLKHCSLNSTPTTKGLYNGYLLGGHSGIELVSEVAITSLELGLGVLHGQLDSLDGLQLFVELFDGGIVLLPLLGQGGLVGAK